MSSLNFLILKEKGREKEKERSKRNFGVREKFKNEGEIYDCRIRVRGVMLQGFGTWEIQIRTR